MKAEILILGVLHRGDTHPYEIKRRLKSAQVENYLDVDVGTLYYAVRQLAKDGLIEERGQESSGRQTRTIYGLTDAGRARFQDIMHETLAAGRGPMHPIYPALVFLHLANREDAISQMENRIRELRKGLAITEGILAYVHDRTSGGMRLLMENAIAHQHTELDWSKKALKELRTCEIFPGTQNAADPQQVGADIEAIIRKAEASVNDE